MFRKCRNVAKKKQFIRTAWHEGWGGGPDHTIAFRPQGSQSPFKKPQPNSVQKPFTHFQPWGLGSGTGRHFHSWPLHLSNRLTILTKKWRISFIERFARISWTFWQGYLQLLTGVWGRMAWNFLTQFTTQLQQRYAVSNTIMAELGSFLPWRSTAKFPPWLTKMRSIFVLCASFISYVLCIFCPKMQST